MNENSRAPQAFIIEDEKPAKRAKPKINFAVEEPAQELVTVPNPVPMPTARGLRWGSVLITALFALFSLWAGLTITQLIESFFARSPLLGWIALGFAGLAGAAALAIIVREIWGLARLRQIEKLQLTASHALNQDDEASAKQAIIGLTTLYRGRLDAAWNLKNFEAHADDILDPRDRVRLAERYLVDPLDELAHRIIARRAKRVTLLTTVTPAAALDILFVAAQNIAMLREIATLYGGRPSTFATLRLARMVVTHLAIAGGLALSDNFLHLFVGKGLLGRLSARFGEGAVNGILTSRIGLAAVDVCRPIPKESTRRETLGSLLKELANFGDKEPEVPRT
jgi:putative membrane protein